MKIKNIIISHFRGIKEIKLQMSDFTVLIGKNGVGKSSILHALNFFKDQKYNLKIEDYYNKDLTKPIKIALTFTNLNESEKREFEPYIHNDELKVIKIAQGDAEFNNPDVSTKYHGMRMIHPDFNKIRSETSKREMKRLYDQLRTQTKYSTLPSVQRGDQIESNLVEWEDANPNELKLQIDTGQFFGWTGVGAGKLAKYMEFFFIPAVHEYSEEEQEGSSNYLGEFLDLTIRKTRTESADLSEFKDDTINKYKELIQQENQEKVKELSEKLSSRLTNFAPGCQVSINFQPGEAKFTPTRYMTELAEYGFQGPISFLGHGVQRSFFFTLLQYLGEERFKTKLDEAGEASTSSVLEDSNSETYLILLIIEEPELYQHPNRIRLIKQLFKNLTANTEDSLFQFQIICSSHSTQLIDIQDFENIRILRKIKENDHFNVTVNHVNLQKIADELKKLYEFPKDSKFDPDTLISRLIAIMTPELSEGFFADKIVLVEGLEEKASLLALDKQLGGESFDQLGILILPVYGKRNLDRPTLIFKALKIPTYIIFDTDSDKSGKKRENHKKTNIILRKIVGETIITNPFSQKINETWTSLNPNLTKLKKLYQFNKLKNCKKNYKVLEDFIQICYENGKKLAVLEAIIQKIHDLS